MSPIKTETNKTTDHSSNAKGTSKSDSRTLATIYGILSKTYKTFDETDDPWMTNGLSSTPFKSLVSVCLSTMTVTKRVVNAAVPLYKKVTTFEGLRDLPDDELRNLIKPVAHYNRKTKNLKEMARQIIEDYDGKIPDTHEELMKLQGVGRKCADLLMNFNFSVDTVGVDTHVLRVLNRLGVINTSSAEKASDDINAITPPRFKRHAHEWLIQHGMKICVARTPKCKQCPLTDHCKWYAEHRN